MQHGTVRHKGFTLVELAVVLVIIGLLIGGVLVGRDLIQQARYHSLLSKMESYNAAIRTFQTKYNALPGDMPKADTVGLDYAPTRPYTTPADGNLAQTVQRINGDGDGLLQSHNGDFDIYDGEMLNFFGMLSNAGLVKEQFDQPYRCEGADCDRRAGFGFPKTFVGSGLVVLSDAATYKPYFVLGMSENITDIRANDQDDGSGGGAPGVALTLIPEQAFYIDAKLDDGDPLKGRVQTIRRYAHGVFTPDNDRNITKCTDDVNYRVRDIGEPSCTIKIELR